MNIKKFRKLLHYTNSDLKNLTIEEIFKECEGYWSYGHNPGEPHALLTSGRHSNQYFIVNSVLQFSNIERYLGKSLADKIKFILKIDYVDCIISSSSAAITLGKTVADEFNSGFVFTEKKNDIQVLTDRFNLASDLNLIQIEELITSLKTTKEVSEASIKINPDINFIKFKDKKVVGTIVHRPEKIQEYPDYKIISLLEKEVQNWDPRHCPLCLAGSKPLNPKLHWPEFMKYNK
jgi:orotate phosphoribosyltransferase